MERITSRSNPLIAQVRRLRDDRKARRSEGLFLGDGIKLLEEAVRWHAPLCTVLLTEETAGAAVPEGVRTVLVPSALMRSISPMEAPQGALFLIQAPVLTPPAVLQKKRYLVLDGLQDPGNVGTILRTADAFGCGGVLLTGHCADPLSPKSVRATMGAIFRTPIWEVEPDALLALLERSGLALVAAALGEVDLPLPEADLTDKAIVIGSEGRGVSPYLLERCAATVRIPMEPTCESLNAAVAAAVVLWEQYRRDLRC